MIYIYTFFLIASIAFFDLTSISPKLKNVLFGIITFICFFLGAFRYEMGGDWFAYRDYFINSPLIGDLFQKKFYDDYVIYLFFEPGYSALNIIVKTISQHPQTIFIAIQLLISLLLTINIYHYAKRPNYRLLAIFVYYGTLYISLDQLFLRQAIAVQLFLLALRFIKSRQFKRYFLLITLATLFHLSAIILFPFYFLLNKRYSNFTISITLFMGFILFLLKVDFFSYLVSKFSYLEKVSAYLSDDELGQAREFGFAHLEILFLTPLLLTCRKYIDMKTNKYSNIFTNMFFFYAIIELYTFGVIAFAARMKFFFLISYIFLIPYFVHILPKRDQTIGYCAVTLYLLLYLAAIIFLTRAGAMFQTYKIVFL